MTAGYRRFLLLLMLAIVPFAALYTPGQGVPLPGDGEWSTDGSFFTRLDEHIREGLPYQDRLRRISLQTGLLSGQSMQNDVFISRDGLIRNIPAPHHARVEADIGAVLEFAARADKPVYLMLIPTASAILQQQLPQYAQIYMNQRLMIDDVYRDADGHVTTVRVYPVLFNRREEYIYYRTEDNLTALGGYYVYSALASRLGVPTRSVTTLDQFEIFYPAHQYYGDLFRKSPYSVVRPDEMMAFRHIRPPRGYIVTHINGEDVKTYHTLYPAHLTDLGREMDVFFGGVSAVTRIQTREPGRSILVFGDRTARSYLPFLTGNYQDITLVDLSQLSSENYGHIQPEQYSQILFAFSMDTFGTGTLRLENAQQLLTRLLEMED